MVDAGRGTGCRTGFGHFHHCAMEQTAFAANGGSWGWRRRGKHKNEHFAGVAGARQNASAAGDGRLSGAPYFDLAYLLVSSGDWAILGACLALAVAALLFIFYIQADASDLAPRRSKLDQLM